MTVGSAHVEVSRTSKKGFYAVIRFVSEEGDSKEHHTWFDSYTDAVGFMKAHHLGMSEDDSIKIYEAFFPSEEEW